MASRFVIPNADVGNGIQPEDGAKLTFLESGTGTIKDTFSDAAATIPNSNPVIADANGVFPDIFITGTYKVILTDKDNVQTGFGEADPVDEFAKFTGDTLDPDTLAIAVADNRLKDDDVLNIKERTTGNGGGAIWDVVLLSSVTVAPTAPTSGGVVASTGGQVPALAFVLRETSNRDVLAWGLDPSITADNDEAISALFLDLNDGDRIDFGGLMFRVFPSVNAIASSGADPAIDNAGDLTKMPYLFQKKRIKFSSGGLYAANAGATATKSYFPSTLTIHKCKDISFELGSVFEGKGESFGDADASAAQNFTRRAEFLATNGGHAIVCIATDGITGSPTARLCGSVGSLYFSSCTNVSLDSPFSNPASLGYAAYAADAWVGDLDEIGFDDFVHHINHPIAHQETLLRREDGITPTGSVDRCGKGGIITEDRDIVFTSTGGNIRDMFGNSTAKQLGFAFGAGSGSINHNVGCFIRNVQEVGLVFWSVDSPVSLEVLDFDAEVGLTGIFIGEQPFGAGHVRLTGKLRVDTSRTWSGETEELANTSIVACKKTVSPMNVFLDLDAAGRVDLFNIKQGSIFSLINNITEACYGGVVIEGGNYEIDGYLIRSAGWGGSGAGTRKGLVIKAGTKINDNSSAATDPFINYKNESDTSVFTFFYHDLQAAEISVVGFRKLDGQVISGGASLNEKFLLPRKLGDTTYSLAVHRPKETLDVEFTKTDGLTGPNSLMDFVMSDGRPAITPSFINSDVGLIKVLSTFSITVSGTLQVVFRLEGDVRNDFTVGVHYTVIGG